MEYKFLAIAGSFDRLHKGHRFFISQAFKFGHKVLIGLTSDSFVKEKFKSVRYGTKIKIKINKFPARKKELEDFLKAKKLLKRTKIVEINDIYGPSLKDIDIEALAVTEETRGGAEKVNIRRRQLALPPLKILEIPLILAEDKKRISSTRIRIGEIDRWGKVFFSLSVFGRKIPSKLRLNLKKPLGILIKGDAQKIRLELRNILYSHKSDLIIAVGDEVTDYLNKLGESLGSDLIGAQGKPHSAQALRGKQADISIIDYHIQRIRVKETLADYEFPDNYSLLKAKNPAGFVTSGMVLAVKKAIKSFMEKGKKIVIEVNGEEDLAGLPAILLAPLDSLILYGQPSEGVVAVEVSEEKKEEILALIKKR